MEIEKHLNEIIANRANILKYIPNKKDVQRLARIAAFSLTAYYVMKKLYTAFFGPLAHLPGPFITRFFRSESLRNNLLNGKRFKYVSALHKKYGHIVRLGPQTVSVTDKDIVKSILVTEDLSKSHLYGFFSGTSPTTVFTTRDKNFHRQRRRSMAPAFSIKYLTFLEPYMMSVADSLVDQIAIDIEKTKDIEGYGTVDMWLLMQRFALDVIGETAFGQPFDIIKGKNQFLPGAIKKEFKSKVFKAVFPLLTKIFTPETLKCHPYIGSFVADIISQRAHNKNSVRNDVLQVLIDTQNAPNVADRLSEEDIIAETGVLLAAGSETTGGTLGFTVIELLKNPEKLKKLSKEIDEVPLEEGQKVFRHDQLKKLPYLNAVINETLRLHAAPAIGYLRHTNKEVALGNNLTLPEGITVVASQYALQRSDDYWEDPYSYIPERWIPEEKGQVQEANVDAFFPFSAGTRACIGKNFAYQEMRIALAAVIKHYEFLPIEQELKNAEDQIVYLTLALKCDSFKVKVKKREIQ